MGFLTAHFPALSSLPLALWLERSGFNACVW